MATFLALFRGINVGGRNPLPMADLRALIDDLGGVRPRTVLQSGNAAFELPVARAKAFAQELSEAIQAQAGFQPKVLLLRGTDLRRVIEQNPFPQAVTEPKTLHVYFLASSPKKPDREGLDRLASATESWELGKSCMYLHAPDGFARSKLAAGAEARLGVPATARNWATVQKLEALAASPGS